jgi:hypothetical protein
MLCEELINTYTECVKRNKTPESFESFQQKIQSISDEDFNETLHSKDKGESLRQLGIKTKSELLERAGEYYDRYIKNQLRESLYEIYKDYNSVGSEDGFESILKKNIRKVLAK